MKLIYQRVCDTFNYNKFVNEFESSYEVKTFDENVPYEGFFLGTVEGCEWMERNRPEVIRSCNFENYTCSKYYPDIAELAFNEDYVMLPFREISRKIWDLYSWFGKESLIFIRPDSSKKNFPSQIVDLQDIDKFTEEFDNDGLALISRPKKILGEWRFVVTKDEIVSTSSYRYQGVYTTVPSAPSGATELVKKVLAKGIEPDRIFCVDVVQDMENEFWVMELTSFSSAGLYANDPVKIANKIKELYETGN
jgi:hypothetical protein